MTTELTYRCKMTLLINLLILLLIFGVAWWIIGMIPLPEPVGTIARVIFALILLVVLVGYLTGHGSFRFL